MRMTPGLIEVRGYVRPGRACNGLVAFRPAKEAPYLGECSRVAGDVNLIRVEKVAIRYCVNQTEVDSVSRDVGIPLAILVLQPEVHPVPRNRRRR